MVVGAAAEPAGRRRVGVEREQRRVARAAVAADVPQPERAWRARERGSARESARERGAGGDRAELSFTRDRARRRRARSAAGERALSPSVDAESSSGAEPWNASSRTCCKRGFCYY